MKTYQQLLTELELTPKYNAASVQFYNNPLEFKMTLSHYNSTTSLSLTFYHKLKYTKTHYNYKKGVNTCKPDWYNFKFDSPLMSISDYNKLKKYSGALDLSSPHYEDYWCYILTLFPKIIEVKIHNLRHFYKHHLGELSPYIQKKFLSDAEKTIIEWDLI